MEPAKNKKPLPVYSIRPGEAGPTIYRDEKPLETPRNLPVSAKTDRLADALLEECRAQEERLDLRKMPMMQMILTSLDITAKQRDEIVTGILRYGESELLCQRASEPPDLVAAQQAGWQPYLDWCKTEFGAEMTVGTGIVPFEQNPAALAALRTVVESFETFRLTGLSEAVGISGSLVLGLALATGHADVPAIVAASELDNLWQNKKWGDDPAALARREDIQRELDYCARWFTLVD